MIIITVVTVIEKKNSGKMDFLRMNTVTTVRATWWLKSSNYGGVRL